MHGGILPNGIFPRDVVLWLDGFGVPDRFSKTSYTFTDIAFGTAVHGGKWLTFNGTSSIITVPDSDKFSFGNGTVDSPFSICAWVNVTDTAAYRMIVGKYNSGTTVGEWYLEITDEEKILFGTKDVSANALCYVLSGAMTVGDNHIVATYDGRGGATAGNGMKVYINGADSSATPTNDANYVAMENGAINTTIGSAAEGALYFPSTMTQVGIFTKELTANQAGQMYNRSK